jgi:hypothetical protein
MIKTKPAIAAPGDGAAYYSQAPPPQYRISSEVIARLPAWSYPEPVFVVSSPKQIDSAIIRLLGHAEPKHSEPLLLGLDVEWKPMFSDADPYNPTALIQLYRPGSAVLFRMNTLREEAGDQFEFPAKLRELLENPSIRKSGLGVRGDAERLQNDFGVQVQGCLEIQELPLYSRCFPKSMVALAAMFLGIRISKTQATSNWENARLTHHQIRYAATDAYLSRELYLAMSGGLLPVQ